MSTSFTGRSGGLPGVMLIGGTSHAGKSSLAAELAARLGYEALSTDKLARHPGRPWRQGEAPVPPHVAEHYQHTNPGGADRLGERALWADVADGARADRPSRRRFGRARPRAGRLSAAAGAGRRTAPRDVAALWLAADEPLIEARMHAESRFEADAGGRALIETFLERTRRFQRLTTRRPPGSVCRGSTSAPAKRSSRSPSGRCGCSGAARAEPFSRPRRPWRGAWPARPRPRAPRGPSASAPHRPRRGRRRSRRRSAAKRVTPRSASASDSFGPMPVMRVRSSAAASTGSTGSTLPQRLDQPRARARRPGRSASATAASATATASSRRSSESAAVSTASVTRADATSASASTFTARVQRVIHHQATPALAAAPNTAHSGETAPTGHLKACSARVLDVRNARNRHRKCLRRRHASLL